MSLSNEVAVMIGGTSGIGFAIAQELASQRANIIITGRPADKLNAAVESLGDDVEGLHVETSIVADLDQFDGYIKTKHPRLDLLVANTGAGEIAPLAFIEDVLFHSAFEESVRGVTFCVQMKSSVRD